MGFKTSILHEEVSVLSTIGSRCLKLKLWPTKRLLHKRGMKLQKRRQVVLIGLIGLLLMMSFPVEVVSLTLDWSDDFTDGNYDGWTVTAGAYDASSGALTATAYDNGPAFGNIDHPRKYSKKNKKLLLVEC